MYGSIQITTKIAGNGAIIFSFPESDKEILNNILGQLERIGQLYDIHTQLYMLHTEQQTKPFLRHCLQQFIALFISVNTIFLHNTPFDETTKIAKYSQKSHSNAFQLFSKHRNDLTPFKLFPRLILFQLIQPVDNLLQHYRSNGLFNIGILYRRTGNGRLEHVVQARENNGLHLSITIL